MRIVLERCAMILFWWSFIFIVPWTLEVPTRNLGWRTSTRCLQAFLSWHIEPTKRLGGIFLHLKIIAQKMHPESMIYESDFNEKTLCDNIQMVLPVIWKIKHKKLRYLVLGLCFNSCSLTYSSYQLYNFVVCCFYHVLVIGYILYYFNV